MFWRTIGCEDSAEWCVVQSLLCIILAVATLPVLV